MLSCDYNGWSDAPEEEREWMDRYPELSSGSEALDVSRLPSVGLENRAVAPLGGTELVE